MPGDFIQEVHIFQCGSGGDGGAVMCSEIGWVKVPFMLSAPEHALSLGWRERGATDVHIPLTRLVAAMKRVGITVSYDEAELARRLGPPEAVKYQAAVP